MKLLTGEECEVIARLSSLPELNMLDTHHFRKYFGIDRESNKDNIKIIEDILIKRHPEMLSFSNFTGQVYSNKIRIRVKYSTMFTEVLYLDLPSDKEQG